MNIFHNDRKDIIFKSKRFFPWWEFIIITIIVLSMVIPSLGLLFINDNKLSIFDISGFIFLLILWALFLLYFISILGENYIEIYNDHIKVFPKLSDRIFYNKPIIINDNNILSLQNYHSYIQIYLINNINMNNSKIFKYVNISLSPSESYNKKCIQKIFSEKYKDKFENH